METQQQLPGAGKIFSQSMRIYQARFGQFLWLAILALVPLELYRAFSASINSIAGIVIAIVAVILLLVGEIGLYFLAADSSIGVGEAMRKGMSRFFPYLGTAILSGLATMIGYFLIIIPGIIFSIWFCLTTPVVLFEKLSGATAMSRSRDYVRNRFGAVFWRLFVIGLFAGILGSIGNFITKHVNVVAGEVVSTVIGVLIVPLTTIYLVELYANLRATHTETESKGTGLKAWIWILAILGLAGIVGLLYWLSKTQPNF